MKESTKNILIGLGFSIAGLSVAGVVYTTIQANNMRKLIAGSAEKISKMSHVDIDRSLVDRLVQKSVHEQASSVCRSAADRIVSDMNADMRNRVKQAVANQSASISKQVAKTIADEVAEMNHDDIIDDVVSAATEKLVDKLGDELDNEVGRIGQIYKGIAAALR